MRGLSNLNTRKPKVKMTKAKLAAWQEDWRLDCRWRKQSGMTKLTFEQYCDHRTGKVKYPEPKFKELKVAHSHPRYVDQQHIPSLNTNEGNTNLRESMKYTGTLVKGIATMHKSNAVPVIDDEQMKDISRMRRG